MPRSSPTTSDRTSATTRAGAARRASPPPFSRDRCLRTVFSSWIDAPGAHQRRGERRLLGQRDPGRGRGEQRGGSAGDEDQQHVVPPQAARPAARPLPRRRGRGRRGRGGRRCASAGGAAAPGPTRPTAMPSAIASPSTSSAAAAIVNAALPMATTTMRPRPRGRRRRPTASGASAAAEMAPDERPGLGGLQAGGQDGRGRAAEPGVAPAARARSVPLPRVLLAQAGERVEVLEEGLGDGREIGPRRRSGRGRSSACVQVRRMRVAAVVVEDPATVQEVEVAYELFTVKL